MTTTTELSAAPELAGAAPARPAGRLGTTPRHTWYLAYLIPGIVAMSARNGNMWAGMNAMEEIDRGTLNRFLVSPARRVALMNANVVEQAVTTTVQTVIILVLGLAGGARYPGGVLGGGVRGGAPVLARNGFRG